MATALVPFISAKEDLPSPLTSASELPPLFDGTTRLYVAYHCPYAQRAWIARNYKGLQDKIKVVAIDLADRPAWYKEKVYPENKVPALEHNNQVKGESLDLVRYIDSNFEGPALLPDDSAKKQFAEELLAFSDGFNSAFFSCLRSKGDVSDEAAAAVDKIEAALGKFTDGPFFLGQFSLELGTGRLLGTGTVHDGLYYLDEGSDEVAFATCMSPIQELLLHHQRLGHPSFATLSRIYPSLFKTCPSESLVCDACELAKHTRGTYPSRGLRSEKPFEVIHSDVWGPCEVNSISGHRWFVTFIDCFSRYTWLYLLKHKSDVFSVFKDLNALIENQFGSTIKILRTDNGTEYMNLEFGKFLASYGIEHQTTCVNTPEQNGVAERKNRHLLEVARSLMFTMNVPKFLWGEAIKTATYLINRMPLRVLDYKTPAECLLKSNVFVVSPKVFGCVCFVHDYRNSVGKLDPRAIKCVFMGYSPSQKGYRCWCPSERRFFVSMDVTFREYEPYYSSAGDIGITLSPPEVQQEGESNIRGTSIEPILVPTSGVPQIDNKTPSQGDEPNNGNGVNDDNYNHGDMQDATVNSTPSSSDVESSMHEDRSTNQYSLSPAAPTSTTCPGDNPLSTSDPQSDLPIALRKTNRSTNIPPRLKDYVGYKNNIANFLSYKHCSHSFKKFIASLDSIPVPTNWKEAKEDPKWKEAMLEDMRALEKNKTWELVDLPPGKQPVGCKWVFTIKHTPEGKVDRYKARLVAKGYTQTYGIDYEETFAPVAKMNSVRTLLSCAINFDWDIYQMDVKNAFLHGDLQEEVYMHIPPGFETNQTNRKVLRLHRSLYGLKQSPRAWFDRFRQAILKKGYCQSNADHNLVLQTQHG